MFLRRCAVKIEHGRFLLDACIDYFVQEYSELNGYLSPAVGIKFSRLPNSTKDECNYGGNKRELPDWKFLFDREGVAAGLQAKFLEAGIVNMRQITPNSKDFAPTDKALKLGVWGEGARASASRWART